MLCDPAARSGVTSTALPSSPCTAAEPIGVPLSLITAAVPRFTPDSTGSWSLVRYASGA